MPSSSAGCPGLQWLALLFWQAGYPGSYKRGQEIAGIEPLSSLRVFLCITPELLRSMTIVTTGGRVLNVTAPPTFEEARSCREQTLSTEGKQLKARCGLKALQGPEKIVRLAPMANQNDEENQRLGWCLGPAIKATLSLVMCW